MKKTLLKSSLILLALGLFVTSCGSDDNTDILDTPKDDDIKPVDPTGKVKNAFIDITYDSTKPEGERRSGTFFDTATGIAGQKVSGRIKFTSDKDMGRLYITKTVPGGEPTAFADFDELDKKAIRKATKPDGSIDLDKDKKNAFDFTFELDVPANAEDGETIYNFWATSGRGDFRDPSKRLLVGVGTIDVKIGTAKVAQSLTLKEGIQLKAPLASGASETFVSFFDLTKPFKINDGTETAALWDFGYYYGATDKASLASSNNYPTFIDIVTVANEKIGEGDIAIAKDDLRKVYFKLNEIIDFDAATIDDIKNLTVSASDPQRAKTLSKDNVIEFLDQSGRKGLIKVVSIVGTDGNSGTITLNVKELPAAPIMDKDGSQFQ